MKKENAEHSKRKQFIKVPVYPGGKEGLSEYIRENLKYPEEAIKHNISGPVYVSFDVDHMGEVTNGKVTKGIGYGCDEEALRLVSDLKYNKTYNRGLRIRKTMKIRIDFKLNQKISINYVKSMNENKADDKKEIKPKPETFSYTIKLIN